jgi:glucose/arabinose dehydrogenase
MKLIRCAMLLGVAIAGSAIACDKDTSGLAMAAGFCASVFADDLGHVRHLAVAPNGDVYVNTWSSRYTDYKNAPGGYIVALRDANGDGRAEVIHRFGPAHHDGTEGGGTGIAVSGGALYVEDGGKIVRYRLQAGALVPQGAPEVILSGLPIEGDDVVHSFAIAPDGAMFVNSGAVTNSCQEHDRTPESPGIAPCPELDLHAGIWRYEANKTDQVFSPTERFATGTRNAVALAMQPNGTLYATLHGRDQLSASEVFAPVQAEDDFGWPYCDYNPGQGKYVLVPEYRGDGGTKQGECIALKHPRVTFPPNWAPSGMTFYSGSAFPREYRGGAFVAFQAGSLVAFVPFGEDGALGRYEVFAAALAHRPMGVAVSPDGALYVSDDLKGRIWKITYEAQPAIQLKETQR